MSSAATKLPSTPTMTTEQLLAMPEDGVERYLIDGELREGGMTRRNRGHSRIEITIGQILKNWLDTQPEPRGEVLGGEAGFRLRKEPDTTVGADVAYISAETAAANPRDDTIVDGAPVLVVEILSPSDDQERINEKIRVYLDCGVKLIWIVDPAFQTITVHQPDARPRLSNVDHRIDGEPHLPGFAIDVRTIFAR